MKKILVGLSALVMVAACETTPTSNSTPYPATLKVAFLEGCAKNDKQLTAFCSCTFDNIEKRVPLERFISDVQKYRDQTWNQPIYRTAAIACIDKAPASLLQ